MAGVSWRAGENLTVTETRTHACTYICACTKNILIQNIYECYSICITQWDICLVCFMADTFSTPWCLYSTFFCPRSRKELKLFVSVMQRCQTAIYSHQPIFIRVCKVERCECIMFHRDMVKSRSFFRKLVLLSLYNVCFGLCLKR